MNKKSAAVKMTTHWRDDFHKRIDNGISADSLPMPSKEIIDRIISECFESEEMKAYLIAHHEVLNAEQLNEIIAGAMLPLRVKAELMKEVDESSYRDIKEALNALDLKPGQFFIFFLEGTEVRDGNEEPDHECIGPCTDLRKAISYIRDCCELPKEESLWEHRFDYDWWSSIELYEPKDDGSYFNSYTYYMVTDEICYFDKGLSMSDHGFYCDSDGHYSWDGINLNISIPFKPGDIVTIDGRPFCGIKHVLLTDVGDDCCGVQALYKRANGEWGVGAVKHGTVYDRYDKPMLSPLYRLEKFVGEKTADDYFLESISLDYNNNLKKAYEQGLSESK